MERTFVLLSPAQSFFSPPYFFRMLGFFLDFVFPKNSLQGSEGAWITEEERQSLKLTPLLLHRELLSKRGFKSLDTLIAAGSYDNSPLLKKAILTFKYGRIRDIAEDLALWMTKATHGLLLPPNPKLWHTPFVLCPVPLHWTRKFERGFNQAEILAEQVAKFKGWPVYELLIRTRPTGHQAWRKRDSRLHALEGAFRARGEVPPYVMLIDDLSTTGTTLDECAKTLKKAGAKYVYALVAAQG